MSKVVMSLGFAVALVAYVVGIWGIATTANAHVVPQPFRLISFGVVAMMGTTLALVMVFAHGARTGDQE